MFLTGSLFPLGIFTVPIESLAQPAGALDGVWTSTIGVISLFSAPVTVFAGFYLDAGIIPSSSPPSSPSPSSSSAWSLSLLSLQSFGQCKTHRIRILSLLVCLAFTSLSFVAYGIQTTNASLIRLSATFLSFPLGIIYLLATEILMVWNPSRPGLTTGFGQMALSMGCVFISSFYNHLINTRGCVQTFYIVSVLFSAVSCVPALLLRWPDRQHLLYQEELENGQGVAATNAGPSPQNQSGDVDSNQAQLSSTEINEDEEDIKVEVEDDEDAEEQCLTQELQPKENVRLPWQKLNTLPMFWLFLFIVFTSSAPFALLAFFFKLGHVFNIVPVQILRQFQTVTILSSCCSVLLIFLTDFMKFGKGYFESGAKNILTVLFLLQSILFACLIPLSYASNFNPFICIVTVLLVMMASYNGCAAIMVRDMFGSANAMVVFGIGAGIGMGSGEGLSTELMYLVEAVHGTSAKWPLQPRSYIMFYAIASVWSFCGLMALLLVGRCDEAFQKPSSTSPTTYSSIEALDTL